MKTGLKWITRTALGSAILMCWGCSAMLYDSSGYTYGRSSYSYPTNTPMNFYLGTGYSSGSLYYSGTYPHFYNNSSFDYYTYDRKFNNYYTRW